MKKQKKLTFTSQLLLFLLAAEDVLTPLMSPYELRKRALFGSRQSYRNTLNKFIRKGWIKYAEENGEKRMVLTQEGVLEALLTKAMMPEPEEWDGKWRIVMFDIPEEQKEKRHLLRTLLKKNNFYQLQASVYIYPYPLNREAKRYLEETGLIKYIRMIKVEEMDNDKDLRKRFNVEK
jgi:CRISPR-associated endonuclease Cas2